MIEASLARFIQYGGASILFGATFFFLNLLPRSGEGAAMQLKWPRPLLVGAASFALGGAVLSLIIQSAMMTGVTLSQVDWPAIELVLTATTWGLAIVIRILISLLALLLVLSYPPSRLLWLITIYLGSFILVSFAWTGHGAATDGTWGWVHLLSDIIHLLAAGLWIGALVVFLRLLMTRMPSDADLEAHYLSLHRFAGIGSIIVATLIGTGLLNLVFIVGISNISGLTSSPYGAILAAKLFLFSAMLGLAAWNRFHLTPELHRSMESEDKKVAVEKLRISLCLETGLGISVLFLVGFLGMIDPQ